MKPAASARPPVKSTRLIQRACVYAVVAAVPVLLAGCGEKKHSPQTGTAAVAAVVKGTTTETVTSALIPETIEVVGTVRARTSAVVSARIPGTINVLRVREGERVKKGQVLLQLDAQENQANAAAAYAGIDEAQRGLEEMLSRKKLADTTFERYQKLFNEQAISRHEFDVKQSERDLAQQGVARAEARLRQAREGSRAATAVSDYTRIVAPISGIITSRQADLGATVFPTQPLMTIEDEGSYQLELAVPESLAATVKAGAPVQVSLDSVGQPFTAQIMELVPAADPGSRTFTAKINLSQKGLKSGLFGRGLISLGSSVNALLVSRKAIVERGALTSLWVVDKDAIARMRLVKTGKIQGDKIEILSGLSNGERVLVGGIEKITEGVRVE